MRRLLAPALATVLGLGLTSAPPASAGVAVEEKPFPSRIDLPDGFQPEPPGEGDRRKYPWGQALDAARALAR